MQNKVDQLKEAEAKALRLFAFLEDNQIIRSGISERELNDEIYSIAKNVFGIEKFWHKRIVRAGANTVHPYDENPPNLMIVEDDILFLDLGPIFEGWEADIGRTFVLGDNSEKIALKMDAVVCWNELRDYCMANPRLTGAEIYDHAVGLASKRGYVFGGEIAGHLIGEFPHKKISNEKAENYFHPLNTAVIRDAKAHWIIEIHLLNKEKTFGAFYEQFAF